ncbi:MAG: extracellular solute-binding protein [Lachnospiraceae bacterium]|nr:extracellular solute-binding protein [Lachnospiraceae bacterium]
MKKQIKALVTGVLITALALSTTACGSATTKSDAASAPRKIVAATGGGPRPLVYTDDNGNITGHNTELLKAVFAKLPQYELEIVQVDGVSSVITGVNSGVYQVGFNNLARNEEREKLVHYTDPIMVNEYLVVSNKNIPVDPEADLSQFAGLTYVGGAGNDKTTVIEDFNSEHPDKQINIEYSSADIVSQLTDVEAGRYDLMLIDAPMYNAYYSKEYPLDLQTYSLKGRTSTKYTYFITSYEDEELYNDINKALAEVIADGTSTQLCQQFLFGEFSPTIADK